MRREVGALLGPLDRAPRADRAAAARPGSAPPRGAACRVHPGPSRPSPARPRAPRAPPPGRSRARSGAAPPPPPASPAQPRLRRVEPVRSPRRAATASLASRDSTPSRSPGSASTSRVGPCLREPEVPRAAGLEPRRHLVAVEPQRPAPPRAPPPPPRVAPPPAPRAASASATPVELRPRRVGLSERRSTTLRAPVVAGRNAASSAFIVGRLDLEPRAVLRLERHRLRVEPVPSALGVGSIASPTVRISSSAIVAQRSVPAISRLPGSSVAHQALCHGANRPRQRSRVVQAR